MPKLTNSAIEHAFVWPDQDRNTNFERKINNRAPILTFSPCVKGIWSIAMMMFLLHSGVGNALGQVPEQDCMNAITLCAPSYTQSTAFNGIGDVADVPPGSSCLSGGEVNSVWYTFSVAQDGLLTFQLNPVNAADDHDFALYPLTGEGCADIAAGTIAPVRCNYSSTPGATGLSTGATGTSVSSGGVNQCAPLAVVAGESYALLVTNFTASQGVYQLNFAGSAIIGDQVAASIDSVDMRLVCNPIRLDLWLTDPILCNSIASNGSDIQISGPAGATVASAASISCTQGVTSRVRVMLSQKIMALGTYTITINAGTDGNTFTDACGNQTPVGTSATFTVSALGPDVVVNNITSSYCGQANAGADAVVSGGTAPYTYYWNSVPPQTTPSVSGLPPGNFYVRVIDANGCREVISFTVPNNTPITPNQSLASAVSCNGLSDGSAQVAPTGGQAPYTVSWNSAPPQTGLVATGLPAGNVIATITDATGCVRSVTVNVTQPPIINTTITRVRPDCGVNNGELTAAATGGAAGFTYSWGTQPVQTTATITGLYAGVYPLTITDQNGCTVTSQVNLTNNFAPDAGIQSTTPDCGQNSGAATVQVTSGQPPFTYNWNTQPAQTTAAATGLAEGDYYCIVTDQTGCIQIINVKIDSVAPPQLAVAVTDSDCGMDNGQAQASVVNGVAPYAYTWTGFPQNTAPLLESLAPGTYQVSVTDSIGCEDQTQFTVVQLAPVSSFTANAVCLGEAVQFSFTTTSGATNWVWDFGDGLQSDEAAPAHTYTTAGTQPVTLVLTGGCADDTVTATATVHPLPEAAFTYSPEVPTTRRDITFTYTGTPVSTYLWNLGDGVTSTAGEPTTRYELEGEQTVYLTVTDANGCTDVTQQTFEVLINPSLFFPNSFAPEGVNQTWRGDGIGIESVEVVIYSRNGNLIWECTSLEQCLATGWDGTYSGQPVPQGVFAYRAKAKFYNNMEWDYVGTLTLIR